MFGLSLASGHTPRLTVDVVEQTYRGRLDTEAVKPSIRALTQRGDDLMDL
jgi:hypothetical protein